MLLLLKEDDHPSNTSQKVLQHSNYSTVFKYQPIFTNGTTELSVKGNLLIGNEMYPAIRPPPRSCATLNTRFRQIAKQ